MTVAIFSLLALVSVACALAVVLTADLTRMAVSLGGMFVAVAGLFALLGFGFLALSELFLYVGGVLILVLFAIMLVHRGTPGRPQLERVRDPLALVSSVGLFAYVVIALRPLAPSFDEIAAGPAPTPALAQVLLGPQLSMFEAAGLLLLAALVAVVFVSGGDRS